MKLKYNHRAYEATVIVWLRAHLMNSWFVRRRMLRMGKRLLRRFAGWIPVLFLFAALAVAAFSVVACFGIADVRGAIVGVLSVTLGSAGLLVIKDLYDSERSRHSALQFQFRFCTRSQTGLINSFRALAAALGRPVPPYTLFRDADSLRKHLADFKSCGSSVYDHSDQIDLAVRGFGDLISWYQSVVTDRQFVDCNVDSELFGNVSEAQKALRTLASAARCGDTRALDAAYERLAWSCNSLLAPLRRPWRYRNDAARRALADRYVTSNAEPL